MTHHHQLLTRAIWQHWVRINDLGDYRAALKRWLTKIAMSSAYTLSALPLWYTFAGVKMTTNF